MLIGQDNPETRARDAKGASQSESTPVCASDPNKERQDLLRRFASTLHVADIQLMGRTIRLQASNKAVLDLAQSFFRSHQIGTDGKPEFLWRIVCESDPSVASTPTPLSAFSDSGLQCVNIGQRGFLAVDLEAREAAALFSDQFVKGAARFRHRPPLDILFCMTAPSLGLTTLSGGCVGLNDRGILVFGPPNSGKTTACYLASKCGTEFHADQVIFLDMKDGLLRTWGDPFPAVFRPQTREFLPELQQTALFSTYEDLEFYYFDKSALQPQLARPLTPVGGLFLNRNAMGEKQLTRITKAEALSRLYNCLLFYEDEKFDTQISAALSAFSEIPTYELKYCEDPKIAAGVIRDLLG